MGIPHLAVEAEGVGVGCGVAELVAEGCVAVGAQDYACVVCALYYAATGIKDVPTVLVAADESTVDAADVAIGHCRAAELQHHVRTVPYMRGTYVADYPGMP